MAMEVKALCAAPVLRGREVDPDATLVAAAREQPQMFLALYDRYFDRVVGYVRVRIDDPATCEDVTSIVFTTALAELGRFRGQGSFGGWLFQIARNAVHDVYRRRTVEPLPLEVTCSEPNVEEQLLAREQVAQLHAVVRRLAPEQQHLLALRYGAGLSFAEIGTILGANPGTVRVRMYRILEEPRRRYPDAE